MVGSDPFLGRSSIKSKGSNVPGPPSIRWLNPPPDVDSSDRVDSPRSPTGAKSKGGKLGATCVLVCVRIGALLATVPPSPPGGGSKNSIAVSPRKA